MATKMTLLTFICRRLIRLRHKLHLLFTFASIAFVIVVCLHAVDDKLDNRKYANRKSAAPSADAQNACTELVHYRREVPIVWIGGVPRSGTTLMRVMLDSHPAVRCGPESRVIPRLLGMHDAMTSSNTETDLLRLAHITNDVLDRALGAYFLTIVSRNFNDDEDAGNSNSSLTGRLKTQIQNGWLHDRKQSATSSQHVILCNKDPFALRSMQRLLRIFPSSLFVLLVRDGRAVAESIVSGHVTIRGFDIESRRGALGDWNRAMSLMYSQCLAVGIEHCLPVHYEQLVLGPEEVMRKVLRFLGIEWNNVVLRHETMIGGPGGVFLSKKEFSSAQVVRPVNNNSLSKWVANFPDDVRKEARSIAPMLDMLGYNPDIFPPDYAAVNYKAELLLRQSSVTSS